MTTGHPFKTALEFGGAGIIQKDRENDFVVGPFAGSVNIPLTKIKSVLAYGCCQESIQSEEMSVDVFCREVNVAVICGDDTKVQI